MSNGRKYREQVEVVEAVLFDGANQGEVIEFGQGMIVEREDIEELVILDGIPSLIPQGHWAVKDMVGVFSAMDDHAFSIRYLPQV